MASESERQLFASAVLAAVGRDAPRFCESTVIGFLAMVGSLYVNALMVVGRAPNGWRVNGVGPEELAADAEAERYSHKVLDSVNRARGDRECPMSWITDQWGPNPEYNTNKSAFWRVIRRVAGNLEIADIDQNSWPSHLVWTNLYKVAPEDGGNPSGILRNVQRRGCIELFRLELATYTPSRLLLLTGADWAAEFLQHLDGTSGDFGRLDYVERLGTLSIGPDHYPIQYVVAKHPERKPEDPWIDDVCRAFNRITAGRDRH